MNAAAFTGPWKVAKTVKLFLTLPTGSDGDGEAKKEPSAPVCLGRAEHRPSPHLHHRMSCTAPAMNPSHALIAVRCRPCFASSDIQKQKVCAPSVARAYARSTPSAQAGARRVSGCAPRFAAVLGLRPCCRSLRALLRFAVLPLGLLRRAGGHRARPRTAVLASLRCGGSPAYAPSARLKPRLALARAALRLAALRAGGCAPRRSLRFGSGARTSVRCSYSSGCSRFRRASRTSPLRSRALGAWQRWPAFAPLSPVGHPPGVQSKSPHTTPHRIPHGRTASPRWLHGPCGKKPVPSVISPITPGPSIFVLPTAWAGRENTGQRNNRCQREVSGRCQEIF